MAAGYLGGALLGAGMLAALVLCANGLLVVTEAPLGSRLLYLLLHVGKLLVALALGFWLLLMVRVSAVALFAGYTTSLLALVLVVAMRNGHGPSRVGPRAGGM